MPEFAEPWLLVCEGPDDEDFFRLLITANGLPPFHITHTGKTSSESGGNTKFGTKLDALSLRNYDKIKHIVIVSDNDADQKASFQNICNQIEEAGRGPAPPSPLAQSTGKPPITVVMLPLDGSPGNMQCILLDAARDTDRKIASDIDTFGSLIGSDVWPLPRRGKMWLRVYLAAKAPDPFIFLGKVFRDKSTQRLIPINHGSLSPLADILRKISEPPGPSRHTTPNVVAPARTRKRSAPRMRRPPAPAR